MYLLKYYVNSRYFGFTRIIYKEFELFSDLESFVNVNNIKIYDVYKLQGRWY